MDPKEFIRSNQRKRDDIEDIFKVDSSPHDIEVFKKMVSYLLECDIKSKRDLQKELAICRRKYKPVNPKHSDLLGQLRGYQDHRNYETLFNSLITTRVRSNSGVLVITVVTSPQPEVDGKKQKFSCEWNCYFCPSEPGQPRSYLFDEPAVIRANANNFDPVMQFMDRAHTMYLKGHKVDKIELIVLGGTFDSYQPQYRSNFVRDLFYAANTFAYRETRDKKSLEEEQYINESSKTRIIGLTLETRPDCITLESIEFLRKLGCTRVQLGVQHTCDKILKKINRGCTTAQVKHAIMLLKDACYKIDIHLMPNLPGASPEIDLEMFDNVLNCPELQVDQWKIYPCEVLPWTVVKKWYDSGSYVPYSVDELKQVLKQVKKKVHTWIRLNRVIRDIPSQYIYNDSVPHMRDELIKELKEEGTPCRCIRCREIGDNEFNISDFKIKKQEYQASGGLEVQLEFENGQYLGGYLRLRLPTKYTFDFMKGKAFVRELHVYGTMLPVGENENRVQHSGLGSKLLKHAEQIAFDHGYNGMIVISGIGTRNYYRKRGYIHLDELGYLHKEFSLFHILFYRHTVILFSVVFILFSVFASFILAFS